MQNKYFEAWTTQGKPPYTKIAKQFGVNESTVRRSIQQFEKRLNSREEAEPAVINGMDTMGFVGRSFVAPLLHSVALVLMRAFVAPEWWCILALSVAFWASVFIMLT